MLRHGASVPSLRDEGSRGSVSVYPLVPCREENFAALLKPTPSRFRCILQFCQHTLRSFSALAAGHIWEGKELPLRMVQRTFSLQAWRSPIVLQKRRGPRMKPLWGAAGLRSAFAVQRRLVDPCQ